MRKLVTLHKFLFLFTALAFAAGCTVDSSISGNRGGGLSDLPQISVNALPTLNEGTSDDIVFTADRISATDITITYISAQNTAIEGDDYATINGTATIFAGALTSAPVAIAPIDDSIYEGANENFQLDYAITSGANAQLVAASSTITIADVQPIPTVEFADPTDDEVEDVGLGYKTVTINLSGETQADVTFSIAATGGTATATTDYTFDDTTLTITAGSFSTTAQINIVDDGIYEDDETITYEISGFSANATAGAQDSQIFTIFEDEGIPTVQFAAATSTDAENVTPHAVEVTLSGAASMTITVDYADAGTGTAVAASDYTAFGGTLTFTAGQVSKDISITVADLGTYEGSETINLSISNPSVATLGGQTSHVHTITDNEAVPNFTWLGTTDSNWNTATNWQGGVVPTNGSTVIFASGPCGSNCNVTVNANTNSMLSLNMLAGYTGTITQGAFTVGATTINLAGGTFNGSNSAINFPNYNQSGGSFNTGTQTITNTTSWTYTAGTMNMTNSTVWFRQAFNSSGVAPTISSGSASFYNAKFTMTDFHGTPAINVSGTMKVSGDMEFDTSICDTGSGLMSIFSGGNIDVSGNLISDDACTARPTGTIRLVGTNPQDITINQWGFNYGLGNIVKTNTNTLTLQSDITLEVSNFDLQAGSVLMGGHNFTVDGTLSTAAGTSITRGGGTLFFVTHSPALGTINP